MNIFSYPHPPASLYILRPTLNIRPSSELRYEKLNASNLWELRQFYLLHVKRIMAEFPQIWRCFGPRGRFIRAISYLIPPPDCTRRNFTRFFVGGFDRLGLIYYERGVWNEYLVVIIPLPHYFPVISSIY